MGFLHFLDALAIREIVLEMKKAALYVRVSTDQQTVENQLLVLKDVAQRSGWDIVHIFADEGISGAKGRDKRPGYDCLLKAIGRREVQLVAAWSVDRLGRSLPDLVCVFHAIVGTDSTGRWAAIPRDGGHGFHGIVGASRLRG